MWPVAPNAPAMNSSESPGRNGSTTSPVSANTMRNSTRYTHTPYCSTQMPRVWSMWSTILKKSSMRVRGYEAGRRAVA
ncbi:Uncharacterised protein [Bordetella pertussis]|nr:Uncharacterised protein [Bordetella pertussis]